MNSNYIESMDNSISIVTQILSRSNIPVTRKSIQRELTEHPDYPSILAINDIFKHWGIKSDAYEISIEDFSGIPNMFIAHVLANGGKFVIVTAIDAEFVHIINDKEEERNIPIEEFKNTFTGNVIIIEEITNAGDKNISNTKRKEFLESIRLPIVYVGIFISSLAILFANNLFFNNLNFSITYLAIIKCLGLVTSIFLLIHSIDANNPAVRRICKWKQSNCTTILSSKASKLPGTEISWSEIGFFYFLGTFIILLTNNTKLEFLQLLAALNIISLPYTIYSIYYQGVKAKSWCILCCTVQGILWLEFFSLFQYITTPFHLLNFTESINAISAFMLPILLWVFVKPYLKQSQLVVPFKKRLNRIKYDESLFHKIIEEQEKYELPSDSDLLIFGNNESSKTVTIITNLFCNSCLKTHNTINSWLEKGDEFKFQIIFAPNDECHKMAAHLISLKEQKKISTALHQWCTQEKTDFKSWSEMYPIDTIDTAAKEKLEKQTIWCNNMNLEFTPTVLINGYKIPSLYELEDIRFFI